MDMLVVKTRYFGLCMEDMLEGLISLWLRSTPFTIFSGHILIHVRKRLNVLKSVRKCSFGHNSDFSSPNFWWRHHFFRSTVDTPKTYSIYFEMKWWLIGSSKRIEIFVEYFNPFQPFLTWIDLFWPQMTSFDLKWPYLTPILLYFTVHARELHGSRQKIPWHSSSGS